jgi:hypothetical protein
MNKKIILIAWILLLLYAFLLAPRAEYDFMNLLSPEDDGLSFIIFNLMGFWPFVFLVFFKDDHWSSIIVLIVSFMLGAFIISPYLVLRKKSNKKNILNKIAGSKIYLILVILFAFSLIIYGSLSIDFNTYWVNFNTYSLINIMSYDFLLLWIMAGILTWRDIKNSKLNEKSILLAFIPIVGNCAYFLYKNH